jgi:hypothetical protein
VEEGSSIREMPCDGATAQADSCFSFTARRPTFLDFPSRCSLLIITLTSTLASLHYSSTRVSTPNPKSKPMEPST